MKTIINFIIGGCLLFGGFYVGNQLSEVKIVNHVRSISAGEIKSDIQAVQELAVASYEYEAIGVVEDCSTLLGVEMPLTGKKLLIKFNGIIKYGYDLSDLSEQDIKISDSKIIVKLPPAKILSNEIDTTTAQPFLQNDSIFNRLKSEDTIKAADIAKSRMAIRASSSTTLKNTARDNIKKTLMLLAKGYDKRYRVELINS